LIERSLDVEILFISSKTSEPKLKEIKFDKYKIHSVPTARESINDSRESFLLEFCDSWKSGQMSSNPEKEGDYILSLLSLMLQTKINFDSMRINNVQATIKRRRSSFLNGRMDFPPDFEDLFRKLNVMDKDVLRQYLRSCEAYKASLSLIDDNPTLSFFLLVTAIEAISNVVIKSPSQSRNFEIYSSVSS